MIVFSRELGLGGEAEGEVRGDWVLFTVLCDFPVAMLDTVVEVAADSVARVLLEVFRLLLPRKEPTRLKTLSFAGYCGLSVPLGEVAMGERELESVRRLFKWWSLFPRFNGEGEGRSGAAEVGGEVMADSRLGEVVARASPFAGSELVSCCEGRVGVVSTGASDKPAKSTDATGWPLVADEFVRERPTVELDDADEAELLCLDLGGPGSMSHMDR
jgi:hypothetical protein